PAIATPAPPSLSLAAPPPTVLSTLSLHDALPILPGGFPLHTNTRRVGRRFSAGLVERGGTPMFVHRGIGTSGLRMRLFCPPEVAVIRLVRRPGLQQPPSEPR